jgi:hypothetical protein
LIPNLYEKPTVQPTWGRYGAPTPLLETQQSQAPTSIFSIPLEKNEQILPRSEFKMGKIGTDINGEFTS